VVLTVVAGWTTRNVREGGSAYECIGEFSKLLLAYILLTTSSRPFSTFAPEERPMADKDNRKPSKKALTLTITRVRTKLAVNLKTGSYIASACKSRTDPTANGLGCPTELCTYFCGSGFGG
jgi:hypothetical protein